MTDLTSLSASDLSRLVAARKMAPSEIMQAFLARIARVNPALNAIVAMRDPDALLAEAKAADDSTGGWLHGLPLAVKDLVAVRGIRSSFGSPIFADLIPAEDEMLAARMRAAGAIFIGKTNTPEFGLGSHSFNPVHGVTANPYDPQLTAGGSSGGAAAALAAHLLPVADGSDAMGSLRNPAAFCNIYGFRPSFGLVPSDPVGDSFLHQLATDGPMARCVEDLARLLETLAQPDAANPHSRPWQPYATDLDAAPEGLRIGWLGDWGGAYPMEPGILDTCQTALKTLTDLGHHVEPLAPPFPAAELWESWTTLRSWSNAAARAALYDDPAKRRLLKPEAIWEIERGLGFDAMQVHRASVIRSAWFTTLADLFTRFDALVLPAAQVWPFPKDWRYPESIAGKPMDTYHRWMEVVIPASLAGLPTLAVPAGFREGLPMGMQILGPRGADRAILRLGQQYHRVTDWPGRQPPSLP